MGRFGTPKLSFDRYKVMWDAINSTGRPMLYSLCNWGEDYSHTVGAAAPLIRLCIVHQLTSASGECLSPTRGGCQETFTTLSRVQMISALALTHQTHFALHQVRTARF
jgi:hypothetical protein